MPLQIFDILFLLPLLAIGLIASWQDWRAGKVKNRLLLAAAVYGAFALLLFSLPLGWPDNLRISADYLSRVAVNGGLALLAGFLSYRYNFMAPGDAKLFFVFALLLPLSYYERAYLPVFPSFTLLANIFLPLLAVIFVQAVWFGAGRALPCLRGDKRIDAKKAKRAWGKEAGGILKLMVSMVALFVLVQKFSDFVSPWTSVLSANPGIMYLIFFLLYRSLSAYVRKYGLLTAVALAVVVFYIVSGWFGDQAALAAMLGRAVRISAVFLVIAGVVGRLLDYYVKNRTAREIDIDNMKPGMRLADIDFTDRDGEAVTRGLTRAQITTFREWARKENISRARVYRKFPFAAWMFLGVILTVIFRQPVIFALAGLFEKYRYFSGG